MLSCSDIDVKGQHPHNMIFNHINNKSLNFKNLALYKKSLCHISKLKINVYFIK
jgi:hypothetical protein